MSPPDSTSSSSQQAVLAVFIDAVAQQSVQAGAAAPEVRGSSWRLAVVNTVNSDGTILTTDAVTARRQESYPVPVAGDTVVIDLSPAGNWICRGRLSAGADAWTLLTVGSGWTAGSSPDLPPSGRLKPNGTVELRGLVRMNSATPPSTALTLPAGLTPGANKNMIAVSSYGIAYLQATSGGSITHASRSGSLATSAWVSLDGVSFVL
jgi:hypothetical protein